MSKQVKGVKGPLVFSAVLAAIAGIATMIFSTGGGTRELRVDLGLTAAGIAFIASLVISALLLMTEKPNDDHLGKGTGINRSSSKIPGGSANLDEHGNPRGAKPKPNEPKTNDDPR